MKDDADDAFTLVVPTVPTEDAWLNGMWAKSSASHPAKLFTKDCWGKCDYPSECRWGKQYGVHTPVSSSPPPPSAPKTPVVEEKAQQPKTTFDDILLDASIALQSSVDDLDHLFEDGDITAPSAADTDVAKETERKPSMTDLLESAKRRKRRSGGQLPSPLGSNPPSPTTAPAPAESASGMAAASLVKALDDFEIDMKKLSLLERASGLVSEWASVLRSTAALEEEKAELFVKGLRVNRKK